MIAKLGFILLVLAFGLGMFVAGSLAPASLRQAITAKSRQLGVPWAGPAKKAAAPTAAPPAADAKKGPQQIAYQSLLLHSPLPAKAKYALQVGMFSDAAEADEMSQRIDALGLAYPVRVIAVVDPDHLPWQVVAVGDFDTLAAAYSARAPITARLGLAQPPSLLLLPPPKKKPAK